MSFLFLRVKDGEGFVIETPHGTITVLRHHGNMEGLLVDAPRSMRIERLSRETVRALFPDNQKKGNRSDPRGQRRNRAAQRGQSGRRD